MLGMWGMGQASIGFVRQFEVLRVCSVRHKGNVGSQNIICLWFNKNCKDSLS